MSLIVNKYQVGTNVDATKNATIETLTDGTVQIRSNNADTIGAGNVLATISPAGVVKASNILSQRATQATTSGTFKEFTNIPAWAKRITVSFENVSTNGASIELLQIGTAAGYEITNYSGVTSINTSASLITPWSSGVLFRGNTPNDATTAYTGTIVFVLENPDTNTWVITGHDCIIGVAINNMAGSKTLAGVLDRLRITTVNGTDLFDLGSISMLIEG